MTMQKNDIFNKPKCFDMKPARPHINIYWLKNFFNFCTAKKYQLLQLENIFLRLVDLGIHHACLNYLKAIKFTS